MSVKHCLCARKKERNLALIFNGLFFPISTIRICAKLEVPLFSSSFFSFFFNFAEGIQLTAYQRLGTIVARPIIHSRADILPSEDIKIDSDAQKIGSKESTLR